MTLPPTRDYVPDRLVHRVPFVWVHGGAFAHGGLDQVESHQVAEGVCLSGRPTRTVDYRLIPPPSSDPRAPLLPSPNRYPAARNDVVAAVRDLGSPSILLGGASAGALLAASALPEIERMGISVLGIVFAYGLFHPELPSGADVRRGDFTADQIRAITLNYVGNDAGLRDPAAFPA